VLAPLSYVSSTQINTQVPFTVTGAATTVTVEYAPTGFINPSTYFGGKFGPVTVPVTRASPGLLRAQPNASAQAYALNQDGTLNSPSNPAPVGSVVAVWGTGFGPTSPSCPTGGQNPPFAANLADGTVSLSYMTSTPAVYAGNAPGFACGVTQINFEVPQAPPGQLAVYTTVSGLYRDYVGAVIYVK
jgi:uncharacterized protein (TIGR03437 family)